MKWCFVFFASVFGSFLIVENAWAWGPATHLQYGLNVLSNLDQLVGAVRVLIASQSLPFLYGCISADIVLAKKLGRKKTHSHNWKNGFRLLEDASTPRLQAFALGYGTHLAADTISHNCFVPRKTIESYASRALHHMYWELRFDQKVMTPEIQRLMKELARESFSDCDAHLSERVPTRIFDFSINKKIFNRLLVLQGIREWQMVMERVSNRGKCPLSEAEVRDFSSRSMTAVMNYLRYQENSKFVAGDPNGIARLKEAHRLRNLYRKQLRRDAPAPASRILRVAEVFSREPFEPIDIKRHKIR